jgi:hypothetical protein
MDRELITKRKLATGNRTYRGNFLDHVDFSADSRVNRRDHDGPDRARTAGPQADVATIILGASAAGPAPGSWSVSWSWSVDRAPTRQTLRDQTTLRRKPV